MRRYLKVPDDQDTGEQPTQQRISYMQPPYVESLTHILMNILPRDGIKVATRNVEPLKSIFSKLKDKDNLLSESIQRLQQMLHWPNCHKTSTNSHPT
ncbi:hypothetical protein WA026_021124 [Henosepilachna vigintioctopunctata]|uniref:Uncharacterized protein n=1 Tax=Henosepilachna vigintioctopunctata TaxID=420089 RepID=A0AAW1V2N4_9CUCU